LGYPTPQLRAHRAPPSRRRMPLCSLSTQAKGLNVLATLQCAFPSQQIEPLPRSRVVSQRVAASPISGKPRHHLRPKSDAENHTERCAMPCRCPETQSRPALALPLAAGEVSGKPRPRVPLFRPPRRGAPSSTMWRHVSQLLPKWLPRKHWVPPHNPSQHPTRPQPPCALGPPYAIPMTPWTHTTATRATAAEPSPHPGTRTPCVSLSGTPMKIAMATQSSVPKCIFLALSFYIKIQENSKK
jgi:hypothetical protein